MPAIILASGCNDDNGNGKDPGPDNRDKVTGQYPVSVTVSGTDATGYGTLSVTKTNNDELRAAASVEILGTGKIEFDLLLEDLQEFTVIDGKTVNGYYFEIDDQTITVGDGSPNVEGNSKYTNGSDGCLYKNASESFISFEIAGGGIIVKVETGTGPTTDPRDEAVGKYEARLYLWHTGKDEFISQLVSFNVTKEGDSDLRMKSTKSDLVMDVLLTGITADSYDEGKSVSLNGVSFELKESGQIGIDKNINVTINGTGFFDGTDGGLYKANGSEPFLLFYAEGEWNGEGSVVRIVTELTEVVETLKPEEMFGEYAGTNAEIWNDNGDTGPYSPEVSISSGNGDGYRVQIGFDATADGIGAVAVDLLSDNETLEIQSEFKGTYNRDGYVLKRITFNVLPGNVKFGDFGDVEFEGTGRYFFEYDAEVYRIYSYPFFDELADYFFIMIGSEIPEYKEGETWIACETATTRTASPYLAHKARKALDVLGKRR